MDEYGARRRGTERTSGEEEEEVVVVVVVVHATGRSLVQRSPTECGVSECDRDASIMRRQSPTGGAVAPLGGGRSWGRASY